MLLFIIHAGFALQSKSWQFTRGSHTMENFRYVNCDFWDRRQILKWHCLRNGHRIKTPSSKLTILVSSCWEKEFLYAIMHTTFSFCPSFSWNYWSEVLHSFWATLYSHLGWISRVDIIHLFSVCLSVWQPHGILPALKWEVDWFILCA